MKRRGNGERLESTDDASEENLGIIDIALGVDRDTHELESGVPRLIELALHHTRQNKMNKRQRENCQE